VGRIAINVRFLLPDKMEGFGWYTYEVVKRLVENHPEQEFVLFFDRPYDSKFIFGKNVIPVVLRPPARHPILFILWFEFAVYRALKKHKVTLFFSPDGYLSLRSKVPQIGVIHDLNFEHFPKDIPLVPRIYLRYFFPKFAKKAKHIITVSETSKKDIVKTYGIDASKIDVAWNGVSNNYQPISNTEKEKYQSKYTNGKPFFLFVGSLHPRKNVKRLIEAFQQYRLNNKELDLVIVGKEMWTDQVSKHTNNSIHFTGHLHADELSKLMAAATIFTFVPYFEGFGLPLVEAMKSGVPVLSGNLSCLPEIGGDAVLYCDPMSVEDVASKMTELAVNKELRAQLITKGIERAQLFSWDTSAQIVWDVLSKMEQN